MQETLYVIATRGRQGKEIYLAIDEKSPVNKVLMKWTDNIDEAMATFSYSETEDCAKKYFKNFTKWYIKSYEACFK